jgi:hypothetical protein
MYVNGKMIPVRAFLGIGGGVLKEKDGGGELKYEIFDIL